MNNDKWMKDSLNYTQHHFSSNMSIQRKTYNVTGGPYKQEIMKEEIETDVKIGDIVKLLTAHNHNFDVIDVNGDIAFKVECKAGTTYLRRNAFEIIKCAPQPKEDLSYFIPILKDLQ